MDKLTLRDLRQIEETVAPRRGWDFSRMETKREPVPWDYMELVPRYLKPDDVVLDVGTGGGEKLLAFSQHFGRGVGIDPERAMVQVARENGVGQPRVTFEERAAEALAFPDETFDVVLTRHAPIRVSEVVRVLKHGGYFVTQGVGQQNMGNICEEFGTGRAGRRANHGALDDDDHQTQIDEFTRQGCRILTAAAYNVAYWVKDIPSLIFWFKAIAGSDAIPKGFSVDRDWQTVSRIIEKYSTDDGVLTNEHRTMLIVQKPA